MDVISEGVETREQVEFLTEIHCAMVQGYYFAKPMPIADFEKLWYSDLEDIRRKKERAAAQQQATDRAHRIGQKHKVTVIRMITRGSIEEQVVKLGARKREMFDQMITAGEAMPTQLTPEDIRALFD